MKKTSREFQVGGPRSKFVLIVCSLLMMANYMDRQVMAVVLEPMKRDLGLTDTQAGWLNTAFLLSVAVFSMPVSRIVDRWSRNKTLSVMAVAWSTCTMLTGMGRGFLSLLLARLGVGMGEAGFAPANAALISASFPASQRARNMGIYTMFITVGIALGMFVGGWISANFGGWRTPFFVFAAPGLVLGIAALFMQDYKTPPARPGDGNRMAGNIAELFKTPTLFWVYLAWSLNIVHVFTLIIWGPALIIRSFGVQEDVAGAVMGAFGALALAGAPLGGIGADALQRRRPNGRPLFAAGCQLSATVFSLASLALALQMENMFLFYLGCAIAVINGLSAAAVTPSLYAITQDAAPLRLKGLAMGTGLLCMYLLGGGWAPAVVGQLSDYLGGGQQGLIHAMYIAVSAGFLSAFCLYMCSRSYAADCQKALREDSSQDAPIALSA